MTQERRDPIPPGRYWLETGEEDAFRRWKDAFPEYVKTEVVERSDDGRAFFIFRVSEPGVPRWPVSFRLAFPSVAPAHVKTSQDVIQRTEPEKSGLDEINDTIKKAIKGIVVVGAVVLGVKILSAIGRR